MSSSGHTPLRVVVEADGGSRGNPGPAGYGAVVLDASTDELLAERKQFLGVETNNVAEYQGLIAGLTAAQELGAESVSVRMDSKLVVEQMSGRWQVKHPSMRPLARRATELARSFASIEYQWIPREQNKHADRLANEAMDAGSAKAPQLSAPTPQTGWIPPGSTSTRLFLVRHGVTRYSVDKRFAGNSDLELTPDGQDQARRAAERLAGFGQIGAVVSSPLRRTQQTAQAVADELGLSIDTVEGLAETNFGDWDGYTFAEVHERWPELLQVWLNDDSVAPPGGESDAAVTRRVRRARDEILTRHSGKRVAVISHVTPIKALVRLALDAPPSAMHRMYLAPASISVLDYYADGPVSLQSYNDTSHLSD
ncbi:MAG TPA: bifunctional RNase H/acid phosphatase [Jatrophihabitans sp.]